MRRSIKKVAAGLLATMMIGTMLTGCGGGNKKDSGSSKKETSEINIGFSQVGAESDWRVANTKSMKSALTAKNGFKLSFADAQQKQENQTKAVREFITQGVDVIAIAPVTETGWETVLKEAKKADIPVITVDRQIKTSDDSLITAWVGSDFKKEGVKAAEWLIKEKGKEKGDVNIAVLQGTIGSSAEIGRTKGFKEGIKDQKNFKIIASQTGEFTQAKGQEVMESFLKQNKDIDVVVAQNDNMAFGAIDAIEAAGKTVGSDIANGEIMVISFDTTHAGLQDVLDGKIECDVECNPLHGPRVEEIIQKLEAGEDVDKQAFVDEVAFASDDTVTKVTIDGTDYDITPITQEIIDGRAY
mgnify:CR=1 FL=1